MDKAELESRLGRVRANLVQAKEQLEEAARNNQKITKHNTRIQVILEQTDEFESQLNSATEELVAEKDIANNLEVLKKAFSTNGLIAYKIENLVKDLEELTNYYLGELSDGRFTLEFVVSNDKLNVQVTDNGNIVDILALSSGELARVNTATLIAIRKLMSSISKSKINISILPADKAIIYLSSSLNINGISLTCCSTESFTVVPKLCRYFVPDLLITPPSARIKKLVSFCAELLYT